MWQLFKRAAALHTRCHVEITISRAAETSAAGVALSELGGGYDSQAEVGFLTTNPQERSGAELSPAGSTRLNDYITARRGAARHRRGNKANVSASYVARTESRCERGSSWKCLNVSNAEESFCQVIITHLVYSHADTHWIQVITSVH